MGEGLRQMHYGYCSLCALLAHVTDNHHISHQTRRICRRKCYKGGAISAAACERQYNIRYLLRRLSGLLQLKLVSFAEC